jgi:hypothetical protein
MKPATDSDSDECLAGTGMKANLRRLVTVIFREPA